MVHLAEINRLFTENDKINHLVKYLEDVEIRLTKQEETISTLTASQDSMNNRLNSQQDHLGFHDLHLESHDNHLHSHDQRLDMRK
ncbi:MAG: hypothetical protein ABIN74_01940 [Ferruginibacter sp.]